MTSCAFVAQSKSTNVLCTEVMHCCCGLSSKQTRSPCKPEHLLVLRACSCVMILNLLCGLLLPSWVWHRLDHGVGLIGLAMPDSCIVILLPNVACWEEDEATQCMYLAQQVIWGQPHGPLQANFRMSTEGHKSRLASMPHEEAQGSVAPDVNHQALNQLHGNLCLCPIKMSNITQCVCAGAVRQACTESAVVSVPDQHEQHRLICMRRSCMASMHPGSCGSCRPPACPSVASRWRGPMGSSSRLCCCRRGRAVAASRAWLFCLAALQHRRSPSAARPAPACPPRNQVSILLRSMELYSTKET